MNTLLLYFLFPILFMFHELEEIAYLPKWTQKQESNPRIPKFIRKQLSTDPQTFTLMVLEEYCLLVVISIICYLGNYPEFYLALIVAYNIHIIGHFFQTIYLKGYVPGIILGAVSFVILTVQLTEYLSKIDTTMFIVFIPICMCIMVLNLLIIHKIF